jgi:hypothetical protein
MIVASHVTSYRYLYWRVFDSAESRALDRSLWWKAAKLTLRVAHALFIRWSIQLRWDRGVDRFPLEWRLFAAVRNAVARTA